MVVRRHRFSTLKIETKSRFHFSIFFTSYLHCTRHVDVSFVDWTKNTKRKEYIRNRTLTFEVVCELFTYWTVSNAEMSEVRISAVPFPGAFCSVHGGSSCRSYFSVNGVTLCGNRYSFKVTNSHSGIVEPGTKISVSWRTLTFQHFSDLLFLKQFKISSAISMPRRRLIDMKPPSLLSPPPPSLLWIPSLCDVSYQLRRLRRMSSGLNGFMQYLSAFALRFYFMSFI